MMKHRHSKWWLKQALVKKSQPSLLARRWAYQSQHSICGAVRVVRKDFSKSVHRVLPEFPVQSYIYSNRLGKTRVRFFEI